MLTTATLTRVWPLSSAFVLWGELAALRLFRFVAGTILALWASQQTAPLATAVGAGRSQAGVLTELVQAWLARLGPDGPWWLASGAAVLIALSVMPRIAAFTLAVVLASRSADDANVELTIASFFAVWLTMLPAAPAAWPWKRALTGAPGHRSAVRFPGSDLTTRLFLANVGLLYLNGGFWSRLHPGWQPLSVLGFVACAVPSLMLLERYGVWRLAAAGLQLAFHATLVGTGASLFCHALLAATALLSLRHVPVTQDSASTVARVPTLDAAAACAGALTITVCVTVAAQLLHSTVHVATSMELLSDLARIGDLYILRRLGP